MKGFKNSKSFLKTKRLDVFISILALIYESLEKSLSKQNINCPCQLIQNRVYICQANHGSNSYNGLVLRELGFGFLFRKIVVFWLREKWWLTKTTKPFIRDTGLVIFTL